MASACGSFWTCLFTFFSVAMATNQNEEFVQLVYAWWRTTEQTFIKKTSQNTCIEIALKTYFHFSHYKSMET